MAQFDSTREDAKVAELHHREEEALIQRTATQQGYQYADLGDVSIDPEALQLVTEAAARRAELVVFKHGNQSVSVAVRNPLSPTTQEILESFQKQSLEPIVYVVSLSSLEHAWERYKDIKHTAASAHGVLDVDTERIAELANKIHAPLDVPELIRAISSENKADSTSRALEVIFGGALALKASDVHIEPESAAVRVRYRLDGVLWDIVDFEPHPYQKILSRLKLLSGLKLNIHDEAQDGRFTFDVGSRKVEVRSSIIPGSFGESIVMRLLDPDASAFKLDRLGLNARLDEVMQEELKRPHGAIITTGPTGSGKTTALYAFLQSVHSPEVKIVTIEDPVEYKLPGIVQTQVSDGYTFASGLRAVVRQDPDIIMVGEIRDREVAETALHAALTGHLVFSTLHTNSAAGAFPRLINLGIDPRMIGSGFNVVLGQRLVRRLCEHCRVSRETTTEEQKLIARIMDQPVALHTIFDAKGCDQCGNSGYKGRTGIYEAIVITEAVEAAIIADPREHNINEAAAPQNIPNMQQDGIMKVLAGITSLDELERVVDLSKKEAVETTTPEASDTAFEDHIVS
ncbi:type II/IV secretion system protein [Candidatus Kaiserbacteria bacterium]|nr:type II/IV secretion system protein [Candidatus Kaiserbacteria bacterium]